jgi:hypothetical protein
MKKGLIIALILIVMLLGLAMAASPTAACGGRKKSDNGGEIVKEYGNVEITGGIQSGHFDDVWDLTAGDLMITFTYDATDLVDDGFDPETFEGTLATAQLGVRDTSATDLEPFEKGVWLNTLFDIEPDTFDSDKMIDTDWDGIPDTKADNIFDFDDQLMLQRGGPYWDETDYDLPSGQGNPFTSSVIWFDRDGISTTEEQYWDFVDGDTYNTNGIYDIELQLKATSMTNGEAYLTINGMSQGFWSGEWSNSQPDMYPAGMTFNGDMKNMQIFYSLLGFGAVHKVYFNDIKVVQTIEYNLDIEIDVNIIDSVIESSIIKNIPEDVDIFFDLDVEPKVKRHGDIQVDIEVKIKIRDDVKVNVGLDFNVNVIGCSDDVEVDVEMSIREANEVRIDGAINVEDVDDDAEVEIEIDKIKHCSNIFINTITTATNIGDDAEVEIKIDKIKDCDDVNIQTETMATNIGDDAEIEIDIDKIKDCADVNIQTETMATNIGDDAEVEIEIDKVEDCDDVNIHTESTADNIGDDAEIEIEIDEVEDCMDVSLFVKAISDYIGDNAEIELEAEIEDCVEVDYEVIVIPPTTIGGEYEEDIDFDIS